ncbi:hypothetical protein [Arthrobacter sp. NA-172]|uniref:hypothetical protein n=1 Tax=Arthrobacter sp. NA-172 TaxID=3367524 RepID=UPI00375483AF
MSNRFPGRRLSVLRLVVLCVIVAGAVTAGYLGLRNVQDVSAAASMPSIFSGYVDVTATPRFAFEDPAVPSAKAVVLSFVVADPKQDCAPFAGVRHTALPWREPSSIWTAGSPASANWAEPPPFRSAA